MELALTLDGQIKESLFFFAQRNAVITEEVHRLAHCIFGGEPMSIDFHEIYIDFRTFNPNGRNAEQRFFGQHTFGRRIRKASAAINGFELYFGNSDHEIRNILVGCDAIIDDANAGTVSARIKLKFADDGYDDPVDGWVNILMFVDIVD